MLDLRQSWDVAQGDYQRFAQLETDQFVIGSSWRGNPHTEGAGSCGLREFLDGTFNQLFESYFGSSALADARFLVHVQRSWTLRPRDCKCQLFGEAPGNALERVARLNLVERREGDDANMARCQCRDCKRDWSVTFRSGSSFDWREGERDPSYD